MMIKAFTQVPGAQGWGQRVLLDEGGPDCGRPGKGGRARGGRPLPRIRRRLEGSPVRPTSRPMDNSMEKNLWTSIRTYRLGNSFLCLTTRAFKKNATAILSTQARSVSVDVSAANFLRRCKSFPLQIVCETCGKVLGCINFSTS